MEKRELTKYRIYFESRYVKGRETKKRQRMKRYEDIRNQYRADITEGRRETFRTVWHR